MEPPIGPNIIFSQPQIQNYTFNGWANYTLPRDFQMRNGDQVDVRKKLKNVVELTIIIGKRFFDPSQFCSPLSYKDP